MKKEKLKINEILEMVLAISMNGEIIYLLRRCRYHNKFIEFCKVKKYGKQNFEQKTPRYAENSYRGA